MELYAATKIADAIKELAQAQARLAKAKEEENRIIRERMERFGK